MLKKIPGIVGFIDSALSLMGQVVPWFLPLCGGVMTGWAAKLTAAFTPYAPFSYVVAGLLGAVVVAFALACYGWYKHFRAKAGYLNQFQKPAGYMNPMDRSFTGMRIRVQDLAEPISRIIKKKTFVNCEIIGGPEAVVFSGCGFHPPTKYYECNAIEVTSDLPVSGRNNLIVFEECMFDGCTFIAITLLISSESVEEVDRHLQGKLAWISRTKPPIKQPK